ncbi:hypothetical protein SEA_VANLEE_58 [Gordonia phage VanLee]|uniref:Uncharacterized protein n=1 Tax=Gordonia phage VanLee TaxID=2845816 RepID=A0A8F2D9E1_9CAUD|nr:hypothetical protein QEH49_gp058 [Gordonia phage VanLee]QWS68175.1 hypothetical protein SEA_VANLEE_58 [Gordonia phage VanLee]
MSYVGLRYPREMARIRGANRRGLVGIVRDDNGEADLIIRVVPGTPLPLIREMRSNHARRGAWQDRHWKAADV